MDERVRLLENRLDDQSKTCAHGYVELAKRMTDVEKREAPKPNQEKCNHAGESHIYAYDGDKGFRCAKCDPDKPKPAPEKPQEFACAVGSEKPCRGCVEGDEFRSTYCCHYMEDGTCDWKRRHHNKPPEKPLPRVDPGAVEYVEGPQYAMRQDVQTVAATLKHIEDDLCSSFQALRDHDAKQDANIFTLGEQLAGVEMDLKEQVDATYKGLSDKIDELRGDIAKFVATKRDIEDLREEHRKALYDVLAEARMTCPEGEEAERTVLLEGIRKIVREEMTLYITQHKWDQPVFPPIQVPTPLPPWPIVTCETKTSGDGTNVSGTTPPAQTYLEENA
jgi:hypothetical protein